MDYFFIALALVLVWVANARAQVRRIVLLASFLSRYQIERLMETLVDGFLRAVSERDSNRREHIWSLLMTPEASLVQQLQQLADDFTKVPARMARFSTLAIMLPLAVRWLPGSSADMRVLMQVHARGVAAVSRNEAGLGLKERAFMLTAELLLFQHTCHWYCRSKAVAGARLLARHHTAYPQVLASVSEATRNAYLHCLQRS